MSLTTTATLHNGIEIPVLGLGVYKMEEGESVYEAVKSALALGYRHIDTASFYQNEEGVGKAIQDSGVPRDEIFVTTKVWNDQQGYHNTLDAFDQSLEKLNLDYIDLYLIHWPVPGKYKETWKALEKFYRDGKAKAIGVSNFLPHHLDDLIQESEIKPMINQIELHPQLAQTETRKFCKNHDIIVEAWSPIAKAKYLDDPTLQNLAKKYSKTPAQIILRWHYQNDIVSIPKSVHEKRQKENAAIFDFALTSEDMTAIDMLDQDNRIGPHPDHFPY
ncbi:glyoxal reductase [Paraliobacillus quinghaiensis]|uniref:Glyoxal reductase n=1 Tax=Paraliobacillus quinghaiensis TaxID=470815 RepID=A0A917TK03_9BACI|nr:aldo/keto reductase [Paraliobacillus quinghaiensis]GGM25921.1 glyoxal reductase [Paraliobacillus quinghaiensis]